MTKNKKKILSVITLNVKGLSDQNKRHSTLLSLWLHSADIILLQETNITPSQIPFIQSQWLLPSFWNYYTAILINNKNINTDNIQTLLEDKYQVLELSLNGNLYRINNIYASSWCSERLAFWNKISVLLRQECINLIGGDFNCVLYPNRDRESSTLYHTDPSSTQVFKKLTDFIDCYPSTSINPLFTFSINTQSGLLLSWLDYVFIDSSQSHL